MRLFELSEILCICLSFFISIAKCRNPGKSYCGSWRAVQYSFPSRSKTNYDVTEASIAYKFVFVDFYAAAVCNLGFTICSSYIE